MASREFIKRVTVLGAGVMGAQIAAHFANAGVQTLLFDLKIAKVDPNKIARDAIKRLGTMNPPPLASTEAVTAITPCNFTDDLAKLTDCDLVLEAVVEDLTIKQALYKNIVPYLKETAILCSNTSGIRITELAKVLPAKFKKRFCGAHFFNPPRYMRLVELIATKQSDESLLITLEAFLTERLGKSVVHAKDVPNFIANRIVTYGFLVACHYAQKLDIPLEVVDQLTGLKIGRPKSATFRTLDIVGLDVLGHVSNTFITALKDDGWSAYYPLPAWLDGLVKEGSLGQKSGKGIYEKRQDGLFVYDIVQKSYRLADKKADPAVLAILKEPDLAKQFDALKKSDKPQAQFLWHCYREVFHYMANCTPDIANNVREVDLAIKLGFAWTLGPYEIWQLAGFKKIAGWIREDIKKGISLSKTPLASWVTPLSNVYTKRGAYNPTTKKHQPRKRLPFEKKQLFPVSVLGESFDEGETLYEDHGVRLWHLGDEVAICSFKSKMNTLGQEVLDGLKKSIQVAEAKNYPMVIWQRHSDHFSVGANLLEMVMAVMQGGIDVIAPFIDKFQDVVLSMRYSSVPVVAATKGYVFGGACELMMHCDRVVACLESYIGLVEAGVGILPAGCGTKEMAYRASQQVDPFKATTDYYKNIAMAEVGKSALYAQEMGYLREPDRIVFHPDEILYIAIQEAKSLATNYKPPLPPQFKAQGRTTLATIKASLVNLREGGFISLHDYKVASKIAYVICGGDIDADQTVDEAWILKLEQLKFIELADTDKTKERIQYTLETGRPLRN